MTWGAFKAAGGCFGGFGGIPVGWCWFDHTVNHSIALGVHDATLNCDGLMFGATVGGAVTQAAERIAAVAVRAADLPPYAAGGAAACIGANLWDMIF